MLGSRQVERQRLASKQRRRIASQLWPVLSQLPQLLQLVCGSEEQLGPVQHSIALQLLSAANGYSVLLLRLWRDELTQDSSSRQQLASLAADWADVAAWCDASSGALQCLPLVQQVHSIDASEVGPSNFAKMALELARIAAATLLAATYEAADGGTAAAGAAHCTAVWQLHSRLARLVHLAAAGNSPLVQLGDQATAESLLYVVSKCMAAAVQLQSAGAPLAPHAAAGGNDAQADPSVRCVGYIVV
jgi:hypothetical protein